MLTVFKWVDIHATQSVKPKLNRAADLMLAEDTIFVRIVLLSRVSLTICFWSFSKTTEVSAFEKQQGEDLNYTGCANCRFDARWKSSRKHTLCLRTFANMCFISPVHYLCAFFLVIPKHTP